MKNILGLLSILCLLFINIAFSMQNQTENKIQTVKIKTSAECEKCKAKIQKEVKKLDGVEDADLDIPTRVLTVNYNSSKIGIDLIRQTISEAGYNADSVKYNPKAYKKLPTCCKIDAMK